jgi:AAA domain/Bifunctional DNA primase/polymerase, N-terminal/Primase C terminal 2 (PriCT-2)
VRAVNAVPISQTSTAAVEYIKAGLKLVSFACGTKGPEGLDAIGWNLPEKCISTVERAAHQHGNIGIAHLYSGTCCLDLDDINLAFIWFVKQDIDILKYRDDPKAVCYTGQPDRCKILYRWPPNVAPLRTRSFKAHGFELRCATAKGLTVQDVLPPSIHPKTGKPYYWLKPCDLSNIPEIPADLLALWQSLCKPKTITSTGAVTPIGAGREDIEALLAKVNPATLKDPYWDWLYVGMALHFETQGDGIGLDLWDNWSISDGNNKYHKGRDELVTKWEGFDPLHPKPRTLRTIAALAGSDDFAGEYEVVEDASTPHRLAFHPDRTFLNRQPLKWYVPRMLPACEITMVYGASGSGKSFFVYDLIAAIAQGREWRGRKTKMARVARIVAEGSAGDTNRVRAYASMNGGALPGLIECHARVDLRSDGDYIEIGRQIELAGGADIVVVDTLTAAAPSADQNSQMDMGIVIDHCRAIRAATGAMIFWIHHSGKDPSKGSRGSSAIPAAVDCEIEITVLPNGNRQADVTKLRDGESGEVFPFVLRQVHLGTDDDGEPITSCVVDHLPGDSLHRNAPVRKPSGANQRIVWKAFQELAGITGEATLAELCAEAVKSMTTIEGERDTRPQRVMRAIETLGAEDFLVLDAGIVRCV